ncbi:MAG: hypothetical protein JWL77_3542 [Chthonomonadaceae bacterium]|nr:hypothetical protein [Chthonomonadaceae bacterium]
MRRHDYAFPFRIDHASRQAAQSGYEAHVEQMIEQVLLTSPGERIDRPDFGCGLRQLLFAPYSEALSATAQILVLQSLNKWLAQHIRVQHVVVLSPDQAEMEGQITILIEYLLLNSLVNRQLQLEVK